MRDGVYVCMYCVCVFVCMCVCCVCVHPSSSLPHLPSLSPLVRKLNCFSFSANYLTRATLTLASPRDL